MSQVDDAFFFAEPLSPDDRLRLIARLWASLPPDHWAAPSPAELAEVECRLAEHAAGQSADVPWEIVNRMLVNREAAQRGRIYSAPRRFDLFTIFAAVTAYSLLFAVVCAFQPAAGLPVAGFVTLVGLGQAFLFGGTRPRLASVIVGMVCYTLTMMAFWLMQERMRPPGGIILLSLLNGLIGGAILGYVAGTMVGGVFLVADIIRRSFGRATYNEVVADDRLVSVSPTTPPSPDIAEPARP